MVQDADGILKRRRIVKIAWENSNFDEASGQNFMRWIWWVVKKCGSEVLKAFFKLLLIIIQENFQEFEFKTKKLLNNDALNGAQCL